MREKGNGRRRASVNTVRVVFGEEGKRGGGGEEGWRLKRPSI